MVRTFEVVSDKFYGIRVCTSGVSSFHKVNNAIIIIIIIIKVKGKVVPVLPITEHHAMKAYWGSGGTAPPSL
jgi:hypothetical protein